MTVKTSWHRYGTKLRHCHPMYIIVMLEQFRVILLLLWTPVSAGILALVLQLYERNKNCRWVSVWTSDTPMCA